MLGPERWWSKLEWVEVKGNFDGGLKRCWRANHSSKLSLGAKDSSNHLVAGLFRNIPKNSLGHNMIFRRKDNGWRSWELSFLFYSQTIN